MLQAPNYGCTVFQSSFSVLFWGKKTLSFLAHLCDYTGRAIVLSLGSGLALACAEGKPVSFHVKVFM